MYVCVFLLLFISITSSRLLRLMKKMMVYYTYLIKSLRATRQRDLVLVAHRVLVEKMRAFFACAISIDELRASRENGTISALTVMYVVATIIIHV